MIYVVIGIKEGIACNILVTTNLEKAKSELLGNGWAIEEWKDDEKVGEISYEEREGFFRCS